MKTSSFLQSLNDAEEELRDVDVKFEQLRSTRERLQAVVVSLKALLGDTAQTLPTNSLKEDAAPGQPSGLTWRLANDALSESGPMSVPMIHALLSSRMDVVPSKDSIRIAMLRKPDMFVNNGGVFSLKERVGRDFRENNGYQLSGSLKWKEATEVTS